MFEWVLNTLLYLNILQQYDAEQLLVISKIENWLRKAKYWYINLLMVQLCVFQIKGKSL